MLVGSIVFRKKSEFPVNAACVLLCLGAMVPRSLVPPAPPWSMSSGRDMQGKGGFSWVHCTKCPLESSLLVKKVFSGCSSRGERFALPPSHALTLSAK